MACKDLSDHHLVIQELERLSQTAFTEVTALKTQLAALDEALTTIHGKQSELQNRRNNIAINLAAANTRIEQLDIKLKDTNAVSALEAQVLEATMLQERKDTVEHEERNIRDLLKSISAILQKAQNSAAEADKKYHEARDALPGITLTLPDCLVRELPIPTGSLLERWTSLQTWVDAVITAVEQYLDELKTETDTVVIQKETWLQTNQLVFKDWIDTNQPVATWKNLMDSVVADYHSRAERTETSYSKGNTDIAHAEEQEHIQQVAETLTQELNNKNFPKWKMATAMELLCDHASEQLLELSGGQFSLIHQNGALFVYDHEHNEQRSSASLSGGETFLASLSLALALAEQQSAIGLGEAPKLGALFIDEGFGTLDTETLDIVSSAIETLGEDRMVCIVTHIRELAERMPVRYEISRYGQSSKVSQER